MLGFIVTAEDDDALYLRGYEEAAHHSLVLRLGSGTRRRPCIAYRVWAPDDLDRAERLVRARAGCRVERRPAGATRGIGEAVRVVDPLGFTLEFFHDQRPAPSACYQRYDLHRGADIARIDHFNICVDDADGRPRLLQSLGFRCSETIEDERRACTRPGCTASRASTTSPSPAAPARGCTTSGSSPPSSTTSPAVRHVRRARASSTTSSAGRAVTACRTPSTCTSATPTATASRSTQRLLHR